MTKTKLAVVAALFNASFVMAGGILTNTNQSVHFLRNPARDASTEIDAAYTNPAGLIKLADGLHFSVTNQSAFQTRTITSTFEPFKGSGGNATKVFEGKASAPIIPSLQVAYRKGDWTLSGNIAVSGGGGKATFNNGLPSFEAPISLIPGGVNQIGAALGGLITGATLTANKYSVDQFMTGSSFIYGVQMGGTYKINEMFSAYGGFRLNIVNNGYEGHLKNIMINPTSNVPGLGNGDMQSATNYFNQLAQTPGLPDANKQQILGLSQATKDKYLDVSQSGWGVSPIIGFNFNHGALNIGAKYEFRTGLDIENKTIVDDTNQFKDGVNTPHDIPALFTIGASYQILPQLTASAGFHRFFDSDAKMADDKQKHISGGTTEYLAGLEYQLNRIFLISSGFQITRQGVKDAFQSDLSFSLNSYSIGLGGAANLSSTVRINAGYFWTNYSDWSKESSNYAGSGMKGTDVFARTNKVFGIGVDFSF